MLNSIRKQGMQVSDRPINRLFLLTKIAVQAAIRRVQYDLGREIVVGCCSLVVAALVYYVTSDFINGELANISTSIRNYAAELVLMITSIILAWITGRRIHHGFADQSSLWQFLQIRGERRQVRTTLAILFCLLSISAFAGLVLLINDKGLHVVKFSALQSALLLGLITLIVSSLLPLGVIDGIRAKDRGLSFDGRSRFGAMLQWRIYQIFWRNRTTQVALLGVLLCMQGFTVFALADGPFFIAVLLGYAVGLLLAVCLAFQAQDDVRHGWCERQFGISHQEFVAVYSRLGGIFGFWGGFLLFLLYTAIHAEEVLVDRTTLFETTKIIAVCYTPTFMLPHLLFQIDIKRPLLQIMVLVLLSIIVITAIYAHWLGLAILPIFRYYAVIGQQGRYYRA